MLNYGLLRRKKSPGDVAEDYGITDELGNIIVDELGNIIVDEEGGEDES